MDAQHPIWKTPPMRDALHRRDTGAVVRIVRRAASVTLAELGDATGYTAASVSRMERGKQPMRDIVLLQKIADVLGINPQLLGIADRHGRAAPDRGEPGRLPAPRLGSPRPLSKEDEDPVHRRRLLAGLAGATTDTVLGATPALARPPAQPDLSGLEDLLLYRHASPARWDPDPTPTTVAEAVAATRRDFAACRYDRLARALPGRLSLAQALAAAGHPEQGATAVADLYNTATRLCIKVGEDGLAAVTADRALTSALGGADPLTVAEARRMVSSAWRRQGHYARATDVAVTAAEELAADRTTDEAARLSVLGNLYATAAYTAAKQDDRHTAQALITEADATAARLGQDAADYGSVFGPSQVLLHRISISHLLGDAGQAVEHARKVNVDTLPSTERKARYWVDVARSYAQWGNTGHCFRALLAAEHAAPQEVRRGSVRTVVAHLLRHDRTLPGIRAFAIRTGAAAA